MSMLDKFKRGAQKAGMQATALVKESSSRVASGSREFAQTFTLPGEAEKAAKILESFLGAHTPSMHIHDTSTQSYSIHS